MHILVVKKQDVYFVWSYDVGPLGATILNLHKSKMAADYIFQYTYFLYYVDHAHFGVKETICLFCMEV
jgi:hypothetical protein